MIPVKYNWGFGEIVHLCVNLVSNSAYRNLDITDFFVLNNEIKNSEKPK